MLFLNFTIWLEEYFNLHYNLSKRFHSLSLVTVELKTVAITFHFVETMFLEKLLLTASLEVSQENERKVLNCMIKDSPASECLTLL